MNVLLTGSQGFIGQNLLEHWQRQYPDWKIHTLDMVYGADSQIDMRRHFDRELDADVDVIVHLAAESGVRSASSTVETDNPKIMQNLLDWASINKVKTIVHSSSSSVYGLETNQTESIGRLTPVSPYGRSKYVCEQLLDRWAKRTGSTAVSLRLFNVLGAYQRENTLPYLIAQHMKDHKPLRFFGTRTRNYTYVGDVVRAIAETIKTFHNGPAGQSYVMNVGTGTSLTQDQLLQRFLRVATTSRARAQMAPEHPDDVPHTQADTGRFESVFGWTPADSNIDVGIREILRELDIAHTE